MLGTIPGGEGTGRVRIYELLAEKGGSNAREERLIAEFEEGLARYERSDFPGALAIFTRVLASAPDDGPSAAYARRSRQLAALPGQDVTSFPW